MTAPAEMASLTRQERRGAFAERMLRSTAGAFDIFSIYIGDRLGFYEILAFEGPQTSATLAARASANERYVREWLEQQTATGILDVDDPGAAPERRRFSLPDGHDEVLADLDSLDYLAPLAQLFAGAVRPLPALLEAYRTGRGVPYRAYGTDLVEGQARVNRAAFLSQLAGEWLPRVPDVHARLLARPPARVADIGCGAGWSSIGLARGYPDVQVDGFDLDLASVQLARANAETAGVQERVRFHDRDVVDAARERGDYDLVIALECLHDMSAPVRALRAMRGLAAEGGAVIVVDERVGSALLADDGEVDWMMYGWSVLHCLPVGMAEQPSAATGTVMRPDTLRRYAREAGYRDVEVLPIENFLFRFYRLHW